jgi:ABC-type protease/lipase transport system fused ATPase/permease subunit
VVVISHRISALAALDKALVLYKGDMLAFGPRDEVLAQLAGSTKTAGSGPGHNAKATAQQDCTV